LTPEQFELSAKLESTHWWYVGRRNIVERLVRYLVPPNTDEVLLDIGCGTGRYLKQMNRTWPASLCEGIDISKEIVEKFTRPNLPGMPIHILDIETDTRFASQNQGKFDLVCLIGIIQILSLKKIHPILDKIYRLCAANGHLYIQFNIETHEKKSSTGYKRYGMSELADLLAQHRFQVIHRAETDILKDYAYIVARKSFGDQESL